MASGSCSVVGDDRRSMSRSRPRGWRMLDLLGLSAETARVYEAMLAHQYGGVDELAAGLDTTDTQVRAALDELFDRSLVRPSVTEPARLRAVPTAVALQQALARQQADIARQHAALVESQAAVSRMVT